MCPLPIRMSSPQRVVPHTTYYTAYIVHSTLIIGYFFAYSIRLFEWLMSKDDLTHTRHILYKNTSSGRVYVQISTMHTYISSAATRKTSKNVLKPAKSDDKCRLIHYGSVL